LRIDNYAAAIPNTFGIDAKCNLFLEYADVEEAREAASILRGSHEPYLIIGGGSNLLLTQDFKGTVVRSAITGIQFDGELVTCGSGMEMDSVIAQCIEQGLYGAENLSLIPGDVGACAVQNIGAYGAEAKDIIECVKAIEIATGELHELKKADCDYGYRQSRFKQEWRGKYLITEVVFRLSQTFQPHLDYGNIRSELQRQGISEPNAQQLRNVIIGIRQAKLPDWKVTGNAGSFFMNPVVGREKYEEIAALYPGMPHYFIDEQHEKIPAGWMIEQCGWKGRSLGRAGVYEKQALILVNRGGATGAEIVALCEAIRHDVQQKFGIMIQPEVNII
jgi:UDP-N-acetylmuramate dehydrogenase